MSKCLDSNYTLCFIQSTCKSRQKGGKRGKQCKLWIFFPWKSPTSPTLLLDNGGLRSSHSWGPTALWPTAINRAGRIILMLLVNCSQITPLEAQLWFYNVQLPCVTWGCCFQETGALMECLCSGSSSFIPLLNDGISILYWIHQPGMTWGWGTSPSLYQSWPSLQTYTLAPSAEKLHWGVFLSGQNWRLKSFWQICHFFFWCWSELPSSSCPSCYELVLVGEVFL